jgi:hypothetical protein
MSEFTYNTQIITTTGSKGAKTKAFALATEYEGRTLYACRENSKGETSPIWARSEAKAESLSRKCGALALWSTFSDMFEYGVELGYVSQAKAKPTRSGPRMLDEAPATPAKPKLVPFITPEAVEEVESSLFDEIEADAREAFQLTPDMVVSCWGDAEALMGLAEAAGVEVGRTKSASGLGGILMAALQ